MCGGHFAAWKIASKVLHKSFYWPNICKDAHGFPMECLKCLAELNIFKQLEMPFRPILEEEIFDLWGIDFMGPFPLLDRKEFKLVARDYVFKWVEDIPTMTSSHQEVLKFITRNIFSRYGCSRAIISDACSHFNKSNFCASLKKYGVHHHVTRPHQPQVNFQVKVRNREIKNILKNNNSARWEGLGTQAFECILGESDDLQDIHWDVFFPVYLWEIISPSLDLSHLAPISLKISPLPNG